MKKILPLIALAVLMPLAGCVSPYYYDRYGYDGYYNRYDDGYRGGYGGDRYGYRDAPYAYYNGYYR